MHVDGDVFRKGISLFTVLQSMVNNPSFYSIVYSGLQSGYAKGVFEITNYHFQLIDKRNENGEFDHYELIIADNSDGKNKRMTV